MKRSQQDKTIAEKLKLWDQYKMLPLCSQQKATETLGILREFHQNLLKHEATIQGLLNSTTKHKRVG